MMYTTTIALLSLLALSTSALPTSNLFQRGDDTFNIHITNNCPFSKAVAINGVSSDFQMISYSPITNLAAGSSCSLAAPYHGVGLRLVGHAEWTNQWQPQALFEFGYSSYQDVEGTAYDLSLMEGSDMDVAMAVFPVENGMGSGGCESKVCYPWAPDATQCWTDPGQASEGSPADTVCYKGKMDFEVVYCPDQ